MSKRASIGVLVSLLVVCSPARAEWRTHIAGAPPILPTTRFQPRAPRPVSNEGVSFATALPALRPTLLPRLEPEPPVPAPPSAAPSPVPIVPASLEEPSEADAPARWIAPLVDRRLNENERSADVAPELIDAILRIEPIYDPTRLYGAATRTRTGVSAGTAAMDNIFADHWQRADLDPNVNERVPYIAMAWHRRGRLPCDAFTKSRARNYNQPALTDLTRTDCLVLARTQAQGARAILAPIVMGMVAVPVFAAPMPGARMSSAAFWAARRAEIARAEEELKLRRVWHGGKEGIGKSFAGR